MYGVKEENRITFYYNIESLFNDVSLLSAYMAKNISPEVGTALDEFSVTDDEKDVFGICLKQTLPNISEVMMKLSSCITNAFDGNAVVSADETTGLKRKAGTYVELTIRDNYAYNANVLPLVDATIEECLKYGALAEFYSINTNAVLQNISQSKFADCLQLLNQRLLQLKRKSTSSLYV